MVRPKFILLLGTLLNVLYSHVLFAQNCDFTITVPSDITLCDPSSVALNGAISGDYFSFEWHGSDGYTNTTNLTPTTFVSTSTTFTLEALSLPPSNLIFNGDFELGNTGFTSNYALSTPGYTCPSGNQVWGPLGCEGVYLVGPDASLTHSSFPPCMDHTGGGNMMMVNGAPSLQQVWCQTITVTPNTDYIFQAFGTSLSPNSPAILQFSINGSLLGSPFGLSPATCNWQEFYTIWNSGGNTTIDICITNQNTAGGGNDFAIDDLFFGPLCKDEMSFTVTISDFILEPVGFDPLSCSNTTTTLSVLPLPITEIYDFNWFTSDGVIDNDPLSQNISISAPGTYAVTVTNADGCTHEVDYIVTGNLDLPQLFITGDTTIDCNADTTVLSVSSNHEISNYTWTLPNGNTFVGNQISTSVPGIYTVTGLNDDMCEASESTVIIYENLVFQYEMDTILPLKCNLQSIDISLLNTTTFDSILWFGPGIQEITSDQKSILVDSAGTYYFTFFLGDNCRLTDSVFVSSLPANIEYITNDPDTLTCLKTETNLSLSTNQPSDQVQWYFNDMQIAVIDSLIISAPGLYTFVIEDEHGCKAVDSLIVHSNYELPTYLATVDSIDCTDNLGGFVSTSTNADSFYWEGNNQTSFEKDPVFDQEGFYSLIITGANGCRDTNSYFLPSSKSFPEITEIIDAITCHNLVGKIEISTSIQATIDWQDEFGNTGSGHQISSSNAGTYTFTAITSNGCENVKTILLPIDTLPPVLSIQLLDSITCANTEVVPMVNASNYNNFSWQGTSYVNLNDLSPFFDKAGDYQLTLVGSNGCIKSETITVKENKTKPSFTVNYRDLTCAAPTTNLEIVFDNMLNQSFYLISGNQQTEITSGHNIDAEGQYIIQSINHLGCDSSFSFQIDAYFDPPQSQFDPITINCMMPEATVYNKIQGSQQLNYLWTTSSGVALTDSIVVNTAQLITVTTTNQYGCSEEKTVNIMADFMSPDIQIIGNGIIGCNDSTTILQAFLTNSEFDYFWLGPDSIRINAPEIELNRTGRYTLNATDTSNGCSAQIYQDVTKQNGPTSVDIILDPPLCFGELGYFTIQNIVGGTSPFSLLLNDVPKTFDTPINIPTGSYTWQIADANGCKIEDSFTFDDVLPITLDAGRDTTIRLFDSYPIEINTNVSNENIASITWTPFQSLSCMDCPDPVASPLIDTRYVVSLIDKNGCEISDDITIKVAFIKGFVAPNIFNPQSNFGNNRFTVYSKERSIENINLLSIFDRWGNLVFTQKDFPADTPSFGWDGSLSGQIVQNGVYVWVAEIRYIDQTVEIIKGDVTIIW